MGNKQKIEELIPLLREALSDLTPVEYAELFQHINEGIKDINPFAVNAVSSVRWVPIDKVTPNSYNPNAVAKKEMGLLYTSIKHDGYTQPVVVVYNEDRELYEIVDGFHRYYVCKTCPDIYERNHGMLPVVVIEKDISDRMAATVRHNRARGAHSIDGMSNIVFNMLDEGKTDSEICNVLGMDPQELLKLKYITGFAKLFEDVGYNKAWKNRNMIEIERKHRNGPQNNNT